LAFVLDASAAAGWLLGDSAERFVKALPDLIAAEDATVPAIWPYEMHNALLAAERRKRVSSADVDRLRRNLAALPISIDWDLVDDDAFHLARRHRLSFYDASYLELAMRLGLALATLDRALARGARAEGVPLVEDG
jgi:predicted nucleic acid-binding protein